MKILDQLEKLAKSSYSRQKMMTEFKCGFLDANTWRFNPDLFHLLYRNGKKWVRGYKEKTARK